MLPEFLPTTLRNQGQGAGGPDQPGFDYGDLTAFIQDQLRGVRQRSTRTTRRLPTSICSPRCFVTRGEIFPRRRGSWGSPAPPPDEAECSPHSSRSRRLLRRHLIMIVVAGLFHSATAGVRRDGAGPWRPGSASVRRFWLTPSNPAAGRGGLLRPSFRKFKPVMGRSHRPARIVTKGVPLGELGTFSNLATTRVNLLFRIPGLVASPTRSVGG